MEKNPPGDKTDFNTVRDDAIRSHRPAWLKRRLKAMLAWLAKGADHTCPT